MRRALLLVLALLLVAPGAAAQITTKHPGQATVYNVTDPAYGAVADGVRATGCTGFGTTEQTPINCATPESGTDNEAAFTAAAAAAGAAGGGVVFVPAGIYLIDEAILIQDDNVTLQGEGASSVILHGGTGNYAIKVCHTEGGTPECDAGDPLYNIWIKDLVIEDSDPMAHGYPKGYRFTVDNPDGAFIYQETLSLTGGDTARFYWQEATSGTGVKFLTTNITGTPDVGDTITGDYSGKTATVASIVGNDESDGTGEESHGVRIYDLHGGGMEKVILRYIGDEGVDVTGDSENLQFNDLVCDNMPATPSSGSCLDVGWASGIEIANLNCTLGLGSGFTGANTCVTVTGGTGGPSASPKISGGVLKELQDDESSHRSGEFLVYANPSNDDITDISILGATVEGDFDVWGTCSVGGGVCDADADCVGGGTDHCTNVNRNCGGSAGTGFDGCGAIQVQDGVANDIIGAAINNNVGRGKMLISVEGAGGAVAVDGNSLAGDYGYALRGNGSHMVVDGNTFTGYGYGCLLVLPGLATADVTFSDNSCSDFGADFLGNDAAVRLYDAASAASFNVTGNTFTGKSVAGVSISTLNCFDIAGSNVVGNTFIDSDYAHVNSCSNITGNIMLDPNGTTAFGITSVPDDAVIVGNRISGSHDGIDLTNADRYVIAQNVMVMTGSNKGIDTDTSVGGVIAKNVITTATGDPIETTSDTYLHVEGNISTNNVAFDLGGGTGSTDVNNIVIP
jgi:hypothetical protein